MSTGTLRRHREVLQKLREAEADQEIAQVAVEVVTDPALPEPETPVAATRKRKTQTEE